MNVHPEPITATASPSHARGQVRIECEEADLPNGLTGRPGSQRLIGLYVCADLAIPRVDAAPEPPGQPSGQAIPWGEHRQIASGVPRISAYFVPLQHRAVAQGQAQASDGLGVVQAVQAGDRVVRIS
jgi:hypothetical protein